jgi:hypothetical protein
MCNVTWTLTKNSTKYTNSLKVVIENVLKAELSLEKFTKLDVMK